MTIDEAIYQYLAAHDGLAALVDDRIYPEMLPEGATFPAMTFTQISLTPRYTHDGDANLDTARFQFDCYGESRAIVGQIAQQLRAALSGVRTSQGSVRIGSAFLVNDLPGFDDGLNRWRRIVDYMVTYSV